MRFKPWPSQKEKLVQFPCTSQSIQDSHSYIPAFAEARSKASKRRRWDAWGASRRQIFRGSLLPLLSLFPCRAGKLVDPLPDEKGSTRLYPQQGNWHLDARDYSRRCRWVYWKAWQSDWWVRLELYGRCSTRLRRRGRSTYPLFLANIPPRASIRLVFYSHGQLSTA